MRFYLIIALFGVYALGFIFIISYSANQENYDGEHYRCYYDNENTECGKTRFCSTHLPREFCNEVKGTWELETSERELRERYYILSIKK